MSAKTGSHAAISLPFSSAATVIRSATK